MGDIKDSIVGIKAKPSSPHTFAGTGFVVHGGIIVTCAHVVRQADDRDGVLRFQIEGDKQPRLATLTQIDDSLDIAILTPAVPLAQVEPLKLLNSDQSKGHTFSAFGYPQKGAFHGLHGAGQIRGPLKDKLGRDALQVSSDEVTYGYSGGPVWDDKLEAVVGMISRGLDTTLTLDDKLGAAGFAIPCEVLKSFYPALVVGEAPAPPPPLTWNLKHPYGEQEHFTGRKDEQDILTEWLNNDPAHPLLMVRALGGFGKSALAWHWLTRQVDREKWTRVLWWSFYEGEASFESFVSEALTYLLGSDRRVLEELGGLNPRQQAERLVAELRQRPEVLLILDGFERMLRAFGGLGAAYQGDDSLLPAGEGPGMREKSGHDHDCLSPAAETFLHHLASLGGLMRGKVLMTTRLRPRIVEKHGALLAGGREYELTVLAPADAVTFFHAQHISGTHAEIEAACAPYGYHPLSLRLLAGIVVNHLHFPRDIRAAEGLDISGDLVQRQHHVLQVAYDSLPPAHQTLLSRIACFRSGVNYDALKAIAEQPEKELDKALQDLIARGLLQRNFSLTPGPSPAGRGESRAAPITNNQLPLTNYDLHPIVRRYAYDRLAAPDRATAHTRLRDYFDAVPKPDKPQKLEDLAPLIELYHHTVRAGRLDEAARLYYDHLHELLYYQFGAYQLIIELLSVILFFDNSIIDHLPIKDYQWFTLSVLANAYSLNGQPNHAEPVFEQANNLAKRMSNKQSLAVGHGNLAHLVQISIGSFQSAKTNLQYRIAVCRELEDEIDEAIGHRELGRLLTYCGAFSEAEQELDIAWKIFEKDKHVMRSIVVAYYSLHALLLARAKQGEGDRDVNLQSAISNSRFALALAEETAQDPRFVYPIRDFIRAHWLLGASLRAAGQLEEAEPHLTEALQRCRAINVVSDEADILLDLARLRRAQAQQNSEFSENSEFLSDAHRLATEALAIAERCGYVLQAADGHLFLAELNLTGLKDLSGLNALDHARAALQLATCDGEGYRYQVAYDEALARLTHLGAPPQ